MEFSVGEITQCETLKYYDFIFQDVDDFYVIYYFDEDCGHKTEEDDTFYSRDSILITNIFKE